MRTIAALLALVASAFVVLIYFGARPKAPTANPALAYEGTPPAAISLHPMVGEDLARPTAIFPVSFQKSRMFLKGGPKLDADMTSWAPMQWNESPERISEAAALLERIAQDKGDQPCEPNPDAPAWPPNWRVRFYDAEGQVMRDFSVPVRLVRCRATEYKIEALAGVGVERWAPDGNAASPPQRLSPEVSREGLLALARGGDGQPRTSTLTISLAESRGVLIRLGAPGYSQAETWHPVVMKDGAFRTMLETALEHPAVVAGMNRSALSPAEPYSFRVLQSFEGIRYPTLVFSAHMTKLEAHSLVSAMRTASGDPNAARRLGSISP